MVYQLEINRGRGWEIYPQLSADDVRETLRHLQNDGGGDWLLYAQNNLNRYLVSSFSSFWVYKLRELR